MRPTHLYLSLLALATQVLGQPPQRGPARGWHPAMYRVDLLSADNNTANVLHRVQQLEDFMRMPDRGFPIVPDYQLGEWRGMVNLDIQAIIMYYRRDGILPTERDYLVAFPDWKHGGDIVVEWRSDCPIAFEVFNWVEYLGPVDPCFLTGPDLISRIQNYQGNVGETRTGKRVLSVARSQLRPSVQ